MKNPPKKILGFSSSSILHVFSLFLLLATVVLSFYFKDKLREMIGNANSPPNVRVISEVERIEQEIKFLENQIYYEKRNEELDTAIPRSNDELARIRQKRSEKIQNWETKIADLKLKIEEVKNKPVEIKQPGWYDKYNIDLLIGIVPFGILSGWLFYQAVFSRFKTSPKDKYSDVDVRAFGLLGAAFSVSICGFLLFLWYLTISF